MQFAKSEHFSRIFSTVDLFSRKKLSATKARYQHYPKTALKMEKLDPRLATFSIRWVLPALAIQNILQFRFSNSSKFSHFLKFVPFLYRIFKVVFSITAQSVLRKTNISKIITAVFLLKFEEKQYEKNVTSSSVSKLCCQPCVCSGFICLL